jgi:hypothetical protein
MRYLSAAQLTREIDQLKKIVSVYYRHDLFDMIDDLEKRIVELEGVLQELLDRGFYGKRSPAGGMQP